VSEFIRGTELLELVCKAIDVDFQTVRRVVLDIPYDNYVIVYIERLGTTKLLEINMESDGIKLSEISEVKVVGDG